MKKPLRLGAKPALLEPRHLAAGAFLAHHFDHLGRPPDNSTNWTNPVVEAVGGDWGMMGNDEAGDCMIACSGHAIMQTSANNGKLAQPDTDFCLKYYEEESGWNGVPDDPSDEGTDEVTLTNYEKTDPFFGVPLLAHAPVHIHNLDHVKWTIEKFGGIRYCIYLPQSAMDQFDAGQPWDVAPLHQDGGILGGHAIFGTHYHGGLFYAVTWGKLIAVTPAFLSRYLFEAHAECWATWLDTLGHSPLGDNLGTLVSDLVELSQG